MTVEVSNPVEDAIVASIEDADLASEPEVETEPEVEETPVEPEPTEVDLTDTTETEEEDPVEDPVEEPVDEPVVTEQIKVKEDAKVIEEAEAAKEAEDVEAEETESEDPFEKKFGIAEKSESGRQNRIPYPRVRKIVDKAIADTKKEAEKSFAPRLTEIEDLTTKVTEFEESASKVKQRLEDVDRFENIMTGDPEQFLKMLSQVPVYKDFFGAVGKAFEIAKTHEEAGEKEDTPEAPVTPTADMPEPNEELADGSKVYNMEGLKTLLSWNGDQVEARVEKRLTKLYDKRLADMQEQYRPVADRYTEDQAADARIQERLPGIQAQAAEARTWKNFKENEDEIIQYLDDNPKVSLEGAYREVVMPKIATEKNVIREELLKEIKKAPRSTAVPTGASRVVKAVKKGPTPLDEVIREQVATLKGQ